jgi:hypothetical protein
LTLDKASRSVRRASGVEIWMGVDSHNVHGITQFWVLEKRRGRLRRGDWSIEPCSSESASDFIHFGCKSGGRDLVHENNLVADNEHGEQIPTILIASFDDIVNLGVHQVYVGSNPKPLVNLQSKLLCGRENSVEGVTVRGIDTNRTHIFGFDQR